MKTPIRCLVLLILALAATQVQAHVTFDIKAAYEEAGLWIFHFTEDEPYGFFDMSNVTSVQVNMSLCIDEIPGTWSAWGPTWGEGGASENWTSEFGYWDEAQTKSYVKWYSSIGTPVVLPYSSPLLTFYLQTPRGLVGEGAGECYVTDSRGEFYTASMKGLPEVVPEPTSLLALAAGIAGLVIRRRR